MAWKEYLKKLQELVQAEESEKTREERQRKEGKKLAKKERDQTLRALYPRIRNVVKEFDKIIRWDYRGQGLVRRSPQVGDRGTVREYEFDVIEVYPWPSDEALPLEGIMVDTFARNHGDSIIFDFSPQFLGKCKTLRRDKLTNVRLKTGLYHIKLSLDDIKFIETFASAYPEKA